jgi:hypothetical protein
VSIIIKENPNRILIFIIDIPFFYMKGISWIAGFARIFARIPAPRAVSVSFFGGPADAYAFDQLLTLGIEVGGVSGGCLLRLFL